MISVDTKKKELVGNYDNNGVEWQVSRLRVSQLGHWKMVAFLRAGCGDRAALRRRHAAWRQAIETSDGVLR